MKVSYPLKAFRYLQASLFYTGYTVITIIWGTLSILLGWLMPYRMRFDFIIGLWTRMILGWLFMTCGIRHQVEGLEHIPAQPCILFAKHESTWETLALQNLFRPQATIIKKELLDIPFFGWAFRMLRPIAINRKEPRAALKQLIRKGRERLAEGIWVLVFPEGTRTPPAEVKAFQAGGGVLAANSGAPVLVIAHDAGRCWPAHHFIKSPGLIRVRIAPPISTEGLSAKAINARAHEVLTEMTQDLASAPAGTPVDAAA